MIISDYSWCAPKSGARREIREKKGSRVHECNKGHVSAGNAFLPPNELLPFPHSSYLYFFLPKMKSSILMFQQACRITLFTRPNCSLCTDAKDILSNVWDKRPFEYKEIEVM